MTYQQTFIAANGINFHLTQAGPQDGPLVLLLHGFPEYWYGWRRQIQALAQAGYRVWAPDQRGYNLSDKPAGVGAYDLDELARDAVALIQAAGRERCFLVGHDWGAAVAWHVATRSPQFVEKLAVLNVPHPAVMAAALRGSLRQLLKSWYILFFQIPALPEWLMSRKDYQGLRWMLLASGKPATFTPADLDEYVKAWSQSEALTAMINWYRAIFRSGLRNSGSAGEPAGIRIQPPVLLLWGAQDIALGRELAQPSIDLCQEGRLLFFEEATHWLQHDESEQVNQLLLNFFSDNPTDQGV